MVHLPQMHASGPWHCTHWIGRPCHLMWCHYEIIIWWTWARLAMYQMNVAQVRVCMNNLIGALTSIYICVAMFIVQIYSYCLFRHHLPGCYYCSSHSCQCSSLSFLCLWMFPHDRWTSLGGCVQHCRSAWQNGRSVYYSIQHCRSAQQNGRSVYYSIQHCRSADDKMEDQYTTVSNTADLHDKMEVG